MPKSKTHSKHVKRIYAVVVRTHVDDCPDTSYLGEYSNRPTSEFSIDRAHDLDCASQTYNPQTIEAKRILEHAQQTVGDLHNTVFAQYNGTLANEKLDTEREALDAAYDELGELLDFVSECDCGKSGDMERGQYRYFNPSFNYVDKNGKALRGLPGSSDTPNDIHRYVRQDYERMERLNRGDWCYLGVTAEAEIGIASNAPYFTMQRIHSGGLWGIESDSEQSYIAQEKQNQLADLKTQLLALGFSKRAISQAFKEVKDAD